MAPFNVRSDHVLDQCRFASTSFSQDVDVAGAVFVLDAKNLFDVPEVGDGEGGDRVVGAILFHTMSL